MMYCQAGTRSKQHPPMRLPAVEEATRAEGGVKINVVLTREAAASNEEVHSSGVGVDLHEQVTLQATWDEVEDRVAGLLLHKTRRFGYISFSI